MTDPGDVRRIGLLAVALLAPAAWAGPESAARPRERGLPLIHTYARAAADAGAESQNYDLAVDPRGALYLANLAGVVTYDGAWWRVIPVGKAESALSVGADEAGRVAVGGLNDLGYLAADGSGSLRFVSILDRVPPERRAFEQVISVRPTPTGFAYMTRRWLFHWDGTSLVTVAEFPGDRPFAATFDVGGKPYVWTRTEGLTRLEGTRLAPVPGGEVFRGRRVDLMLPADRGTLVSVRGEGLFLFDEGRAVPFASEASRWTAAKRLLNGCRLPDGRWALGSVAGGMMLLSREGRVDRVIDTSVGLPDDFVTGAAVDPEGSLWLSFNNGLSRVQVGSPLSVLDARAGLKGSVYNLARHRGGLWVSTSAGLFTTAGAAGTAVRHLSQIPASAWGLLSADEDLLVGAGFGVYSIRGDAVRLVPGTDSLTAYALARSLADRERVWAGFAEGLGILRRRDGRWSFEGLVEGVPVEVRTVIETPAGVVWCGTSLDGHVRVDLPPASRPEAPPKVHPTAEEGPTYLFPVAGRILATREGRILRLDEATGALSPDAALGSGPSPSPRHLSYLAEDVEGNLWTNLRPPVVAVRRGAVWSERRSLAALPAQAVETILAEPDGVVWLATEVGLFRHAGSFRGTPDAPRPPGFARIAMGDQVLFGGAPGSTSPAVELPAETRRLRVEIAPFSHRAGLRYQTWLEPLDAVWDAPTSEPFADLTRVPPGAYTLHARTLGPSGAVSPEVTWAFRVRAPWYRTPWALALWAALAVAGLRGYGRLRSRAARQVAARLEARVAEQTAELQRTIADLRRAQAEVEAANAQLSELSLHDDLTGIANRRRLERSLKEEWVRARRHGQPIAFVLMDLDHFKLLNDSRGHREGDLCLQAIAGHLAEQVRRTGDVLARYGGEEFVVLLPNTDLAGALRVAEQLRAGIEALGIANEAAPGGRITASFGVAACVPEADAAPDALVEAADRALYRAKSAGRNRVDAAALAGPP